MNSGTSVIFGSANSASIGAMISRAVLREAPAASPTAIPMTPPISIPAATVRNVASA